MSDFAALRHNDWKLYLRCIPRLEESAHIIRARWRAKQHLRDKEEANKPTLSDRQERVKQTVLRKFGDGKR